MKKSIFLGALLCACAAFAEEAPATSAWRANFRDVSLNFSNTTVSNAKEYADSPVTAFNTDSQTTIIGKLDFVLEHDLENGRWDNNILLNYGKVKQKDMDGVKSSNETADKILISTDYTHRLWNYKDAKIGPFINVGYQTEFTKNEDAPRYQAVFAKNGVKLYEGKFFKELYAAMVEEYNFTYSNDKEILLAWEIGFRAEHQIREGVKALFTGSYRDYFYHSEDIPTDFKYDLDLTAKLEVALNKTLNLSPYVSYRRAQAKGTSATGSNFMIGISLGYKELFNL